MSLIEKTVARSVNYEVTIADIARRSERRAWRVASGASLMALILAAGYFYFLPLHEKVPYLVMADAYTGTSTVARLQGDFTKNSITASEAINHSNVAHFILARESGAKGWDKDRYKGIDHIVFVLRDPRGDEMMVSQSRGGEGVELLPLDDYLAYKHSRGAKLFASDPLAEARSLLQSQKDFVPQTAGVGAEPDRRSSHKQEANLNEQAETRAADAPVGLKRRPLLSEPGHPDYLLYVQSYDRLKQLSTELGFKDESAYVNAAASIAAEAKVQNLKRVDHVLLSTHGLSLFAVQGKTDDPGNQWIQIDKAAAVSHAVQLSTIEVDVLRQKRQEELSLDTEFRTAMTR